MKTSSLHVAAGHLGLPRIWKKKSRQSAFYPLRAGQVVYITRLPIGCGRSSGVERYLAKVNVVSSNLIARSKFSLKINNLQRIWAFIFCVIFCWYHSRYHF